MDKIPLYREGKLAGELTAVRDDRHTWFAARCRVPKEQAWSVWVVGETGELRLGVLEWCGDYSALRRRFSDRMTRPAGRWIRGEIRAVDTGRKRVWCPLAEIPFHTAWLRENLRGLSGILVSTEKKRKLLAIPYVPQTPFPLASMFCLAEMQQIHGGLYVVFCFDENEQPVFRKNCGKIEETSEKN